MKKDGIFVLISVIFISLVFANSADASLCTIEVVEPTVGDYLSGDANIYFTAFGPDCPPGFDLYYMEGESLECSNLSDWQLNAYNIDSEVTLLELPYIWDTISDSQGDSNDYCLAVFSDIYFQYPDWAYSGFFTIDNTPPEANANGPYFGEEGTAILFDASATEYGFAPIETYEWDWTCDGTYEESTNDSTINHIYTDNYNGDACLRVTDVGGLEDNTTTLVTVNNSDPIADANGPYVGDEASPVTFDACNSTDPGLDDILTYSWDWDCDLYYDETTSECSIDHTYLDDYDSCVNLLVEDDDGGSDTDSTNVTINNLPPIANVSGPYTGMEGETITFNACSSYDPSPEDTLIYQWDWNNGTLAFDGESSEECTIENTWYSQETFNVGVKVKDDDGGSDIDISTVTIIDSVPSAEFSADPLNGTEPLTVCFTDESTTTYDPIIAWLWTFGDGGASEERDPCYEYEQNGIYNVSLRVEDSDGSNNLTIKTNYIEVYDTIPDADFVCDPSSGDEPLYVECTDLSTAYDDPIIAWAWDFECDEAIDSYEQNPNYTYNQNGLYGVCLTVTDNDGSENTEIREEYIEVLDTEPIAGFYCDPLEGSEQLDTSCNDTSISYDNELSYLWEVTCYNGELYNSTEKNPEFTILQDTTCDVSLKVTEDDEDSDDAEEIAYLTILDTEPTAFFTEDPLNPNEGELVNFTDGSISYDGIVSWNWNFGDGSDDSDEQNPVHTYLDNGLYLVTLTVYEEDGDFSSFSELKVVNDLGPEAFFTEDPLNPNEGELVNFTDESSSYPDLIVSWLWDFGDGGTSDEQYPTHTYLDNWLYNVCLTVTDDDGSNNTFCEEKTVNDLGPIANFTEDPQLPEEGQEVQFTDTSFSYPDAIITWNWTFGDGGTSDEQYPNHTYMDDGDYTVTLTVTDDDGSQDTFVEEFKVVSNVAPTIILPDPLPLATAGQLYNLDLDAYDPGDDTYFFTLIDGPEGLTIDANTGLIEWTPLNEQKGVHEITVRVTDEDDDYTETTFEIIVNSWNIELPVGWSIFSIPLVPESTDVEDVLSDVLENTDVVWAYKYNPLTGENEWFFVNNETGDLTEIIPGYGYYINLLEPGVISGVGEKTYEAPLGNPVVKIAPGYNLIGHYGINTVPDYLEVYDVSIVQDLYPDTLTDINGIIQTQLNPGEGYWYFLSRDIGDRNFVDYTISVADYDFD